MYPGKFVFSCIAVQRYCLEKLILTSVKQEEVSTVVKIAVNKVERQKVADQIKLGSVIFRNKRFSGVSVTFLQWTVRGALGENLLI